MKKYVSKSKIMKEGKRGTYITKYGGTGLGYQYQNKIYKSCGNGYYEDITEKIDKFYNDNGQKYIEKIKELNLFPQYEIK